MAICNNKKCSLGECDQPETCTAYVPAITNADRIRSMSDEELSVFLCDDRPCDFCTCPGFDLCTMDGGKANGLLKWLQQPAEKPKEDV